MLSLLAPTRTIARDHREAPTLQGPAQLSVGRTLGMTDRDAPTAEQQRTAYRGLIARLARLRAHAVAQAMLGATVERETAPDVFEPVGLTHPWTKLLRVPSPHFDRHEVWTWAQQAKDLGRGAFFYVERDGRGVPVALVPVFPAFGEVRPVGGPSGEVAGYVFHRADGHRDTWAPGDVLWIRHPHPVSPYESASLLEISAYEADTDLYAHVYRRDLLKNGGFPKLQATTKEALTAPQVATAEQSLRTKVWGQERTGTIPVFSNGAELKPIGVSAQDMEYVDAARLTREELFDIWGVPKGLLSENATYANSLNAARVFAQWTVEPEAEANAGQLTVGFRRAFGADPKAGLVIRPADVVPLDPEFVLRRDEVHLRSGQRTLNEVRERDGEDPYGPEGDVPLVSAAVTPLERVVNPPKPTAPAAPAPSAPADDDEEEPEEETEEEDEEDRAARRRAEWARTDRRLTFRVLGRMRRRGDEILEEDLAIEWRAVDQAKQEAERPLVDVAERFIERVRDEVVAAVRDTSRAETVLTAASVFDLARWLDEIEATLGPSVAQALRAGFDAGALRVAADLTFDPARPQAQVALARLLQASHSIPETLQADVERVISEGLAASKTADEIARELGGHLDGIKPWKARQIAQTAGTGAFEAGQAEAFREAGVSTHRWLSQRDGSTRPEHDALDGEEVAVGTAFSNGLRFPADPDGAPASIVNCRCTTLPVLSDEEEGEPRQIVDVSGLSEREMEWVNRGLRDAAIRRDYPAARDAHGSTNALAVLAERHLVSESTVRRAIWGS